MLPPCAQDKNPPRGARCAGPRSLASSCAALPFVRWMRVHVSLGPPSRRKVRESEREWANECDRDLAPIAPSALFAGGRSAVPVGSVVTGAGLSDLEEWIMVVTELE